MDTAASLSEIKLYSSFYTLAAHPFYLTIADAIIRNAISIVKKLHFYIYKENSAVRMPSNFTPRSPPPPPAPLDPCAAALTCPSHIDSPPEGPNQFLLF